jgi:N-hydroxyarylamine O-acetyltransferase
MLPCSSRIFRLFPRPVYELDMNAGLNRISLPAADAPSEASLRAIIAHHTTAIPFENLDIVLGRPIQPTPVEASNGGYCFQVNTFS